MKAKTQQEQFREDVLALELEARYLKAQYERKYYYMADKHITPEFVKVRDGVNEEIAEATVTEDEAVGTEA